ncbi:MAG: hypothetical protein U9N54_07690 [candidate division Zixibacteria bacterium]|nr:hypothetical protein [candidate division Zixibacteria bacterium]
MASKKIYCSACQLYLGEIKLAKLRKNISYLCEQCESDRYANFKTSKTNKPSKTNGNTLDDFFGGVFK